MSLISQKDREMVIDALEFYLKESLRDVQIRKQIIRKAKSEIKQRQKSIDDFEKHIEQSFAIYYKYIIIYECARSLYNLYITNKSEFLQKVCSLLMLGLMLDL